MSEIAEDKEDLLESELPGDVPGGAGLPPAIIKPIDKRDVHRICSGQVVLNLAIAVKELVENSLDAGATIVEIKLKDYGKDSIEVSDNGSGVQEENFSGLTLKYHTSKLNDFSDLLSVSTYGFRGEALSSLCSLSELSVLTRHKSAESGSKISYDSMGHIKSVVPHARQIGTTVTLRNLFSTLPVRQKEFHRNIKRDFNRMIQILYSYCLVCENVKITCSNQTTSGKSLVMATQGSNLRDNIASIFGMKQLQSLLELKPHFPTALNENIKESFYKNLNKNSQDDIKEEEIKNIGDIVVSEDELELSEESSNEATQSIDAVSGSQSASSSSSRRTKKANCPFDFYGYISTCTHGAGRSTADRQFFYINSRPCEPKKVMKLCNEVYKQFNPSQYPFIFLNIFFKKSLVDVNVTPDKRKVFFDKEKYLLDVMKESIYAILENIPSTIGSNSSISYKRKSDSEIPNTKNPRIFASFLSQFSSKSDTSSVSIAGKRKSTTMDDFISKISKVEQESPPKRIEDDDDIIENSIESPDNESSPMKTEVETVVFNFSDEAEIRPSQIVELDDILNDNDVDRYKKADNRTGSKKSTEAMNNQNISYPLINERTKDEKIKDSLANCDNPIKNDLHDDSFSLNISCEPSKSSTSTENLTDIQISSNLLQPPTITISSNEFNPKDDKSTPNIIIDDSIRSRLLGRKSCEINVSLEEIKRQSFQSSLIQERENKKIDKVRFRSEINPKNNQECEDELKKEISKDMFSKMLVIGQFNLGFIITQLGYDLFIIDQHATDEKFNFETLQKNTILSNQKFVVPQSLELTGVNERILIDNIEVFRKNGFDFIIDENEPPTKRVKLSCVPYSKNWMFGKEDIDELLFMLKDAPNEFCRPSRVRAMFASRACRKSVMIGTALSKADMKKLVDHMGLIEQPWNCPHGRPTIRHLVNMGLIEDCD